MEITISLKRPKGFVNYPELHEMFIAAYFSGKGQDFVNTLVNILSDDKFSRKYKFFPEVRKAVPFLTEFSPLKDPFTIQGVINQLFALGKHDPWFVEKSYYLLDELISYVKREGQKEIVDYIDAHPEVRKIPEWFATHEDMCRETHLEQDLTLSEFESKKSTVRDYCKKYRYHAYSIHGRILNMKKKRLKKKIAVKCVKRYVQ